MRTYGSVDYENGRWVIQTEPQVAIRLKRVFERISKGAYGKIELADSIENCRELLWFLERYPMQVGRLDYLKQRSEEHKARESLVASIVAGDYKPPVFQLALPPRVYQSQAADLLLKTGRLLLADDLGVGKTLSAICSFCEPKTLPALVVTLTHLPRQWENEIKKFAPTLQTHVIKTGKVYDLTKGLRGKTVPFPDVIIINYHKLATWADTLAPLVNSIVFDECQELRRAGSNKYSAAVHIASNAKYRTGLSATPIFNYGGEIFNVLDAIDRDCLGSRAEFLREWCNGESYYGIDQNKITIRDPKAFGFYLREQGLMLRRTRAEVGRELPALTRIPHTIDADVEALNKVGSSVAELAKIILQQGGDRLQKMQAGGELDWRLRQATGIAKAPYVAEFVRLLVESGESVVLYGWHHEVYEIWKDKLKDLNPAMYTGRESLVQKELAKQRFLNGQSKVLIMSLRAGAGLDGLQAKCRTVVSGELDWSPKVHDQCVGRVYRDGQTDPVCAYYLISDTGSDPVIADVLNLKKQQSEGIIDPNGSLIEDSQAPEDRMKLLAAQVLARYTQKDG